jgi:hypothetical protein
VPQKQKVKQVHWQNFRRKNLKKLQAKKPRLKKKKQKALPLKAKVLISKNRASLKLHLAKLLREQQSRQKVKHLRR